MPVPLYKRFCFITWGKFFKKKKKAPPKKTDLAVGGF